MEKKYESDAFPTFAFTNEYFKINFDNTINEILCTTRSKSISIIYSTDWNLRDSLPASHSNCEEWINNINLFMYYIITRWDAAAVASVPHIYYWNTQIRQPCIKELNASNTNKMTFILRPHWCVKNSDYEWICRALCLFGIARCTISIESTQNSGTFYTKVWTFWVGP